MGKIRIGILGCGQIAQIMHLPYLSASEEFEVYALCDVSRELIRAVGAQYNVPESRQYTDFDSLLANKDIEAVVICSKEHYTPVIAAAKAHKHIFVEKPFGFSLQQAEEMVRVAEENNVKLMVGYMKVYDSGYIYAKERIRNMKNISLVRVHDFGGSFSYTRDVFDIKKGNDVDPAFYEKGKAENNQMQLDAIGEENREFLPAYSLLLGVSSHDLVLLRHAFGNDAEVLFTSVHGSFLSSIIRFGSVECILESGLVMKRAIWDENLTVYSDDANLRLEFPWPYLKNAPSVVHISENYGDGAMPCETSISTSFSEAYRNELHHFHDCIVNDLEPVTSGRDAVNDLRLMRDIIAAARRS